VELEPSLVDENLKRALAAAGSLIDVTLKTHPEDLERIREIAPALAEELKGGAVKLDIQSSGEVDRGGVIVLYEEGMIDARFSRQLDKVADVVVELVAQGTGREDASMDQEGSD
jgi:flagellar biosynthesis/type III secretory pathway protein FliH